MVSDKFIELVLELGISEKDGFDYKIKSNMVEIALPSCTAILRLDAKNINALYKGASIIKVNNFKHHPHSGFSFNNYAEFLVKFHYSDYSAFGWDDLWLEDEKFIFLIDKCEIEISKVSPYFILFLGNYYFDLDDNYEHLTNSATIKLKNLNSVDPEDIINQALYYLNSSIFEKLNLSASIRHIFPYDDFNDFFKLNRKLAKTLKHKTKKKLINENKEPLVLFNYASTISGENQFLGFYRVLEYYFDRYKLNKIKNYRFNKTISDEELIKFAATKGELDHLKGLLKDITNDKTQKFICNLAVSNRLIKENNFDVFIKETYNFRNSIVHSKESQIEFTEIPDQFNIDRIELLKKWSKVIKVLANMAINKFNEI